MIAAKRLCRSHSKSFGDCCTDVITSRTRRSGVRCRGRAARSCCVIAGVVRTARTESACARMARARPSTAVLGCVGSVAILHSPKGQHPEAAIACALAGRDWSAGHLGGADFESIGDRGLGVADVLQDPRLGRALLRFRRLLVELRLRVVGAQRSELLVTAEVADAPLRRRPVELRDREIVALEVGLWRGAGLDALPEAR